MFLKELIGVGEMERRDKREKRREKREESVSTSSMY